VDAFSCAVVYNFMLNFIVKPPTRTRLHVNALIAASEINAGARVQHNVEAVIVASVRL
jgi:hypothetical protein